MEININPMKKQTVSDDPELAKVLAGVNGQAQAQADETTDEEQEEELQYENLGEITIEDQPAPEQSMIENPTPVEVSSQQAPADMNFAPPVLGGLNLDDIKVHALADLRPLVDKLTVSSEEKFDIYLLLLRSSDDNTLIEPAYNAARSIEDETKRANALLDVIKEIDYFNSKK